jgi:hypothetical protein
MPESARTLSLWSPRVCSTRPTWSVSTRKVATHFPLAVLQFFVKDDNSYESIADTGSLPGVLAVSPEGAVRHWTAPNAAHCDVSVDFRGQVALSLKQIDRRRFLLSTTTDSFYLIAINVDSSGKQSVSLFSNILINVTVR